MINERGNESNEKNLRDPGAGLSNLTYFVSFEAFLEDKESILTPFPSFAVVCPPRMSKLLDERR